MKIALIGKGRWGSKYIKMLDGFPGVDELSIYTHNYKELKNKDIDGIIIATPASTHAEIIHFFPDTYLLVEKPFVTTLADAESIHNEKIMVGYTYLYHPKVTQIKQKNIRNSFYFRLENTNSFHSSTSVVWELGSHGVSMVVSLFGEPKEIKAKYTKEGNVHVHLLQCNKVDCQLEFGWNYKFQRRVLFADGKIPLELEAGFPTPLANEVSAFFQFIKGKPIETGLDFGLRVTRVLDKIEKSLL
jgi:predicted dehydrogenase